MSNSKAPVAGDEAAVKELSFEEAFARLEQVVRRLEGGEVSLEESLRLFEEGVRLTRVCSAKLTAAEGRLSQLVESETGDAVEAPFDVLPGAASS